MAECVSQSIKGHNQFNRAVPWFMLLGIGAMAIFQLRFVTQMLHTFEAVLVVPLYQCSFTISLIVFGLIFFGEFENMSTSEIGGFCGATAVCCVGIGILSARPVPTDEDMARAHGAVSEPPVEPVVPDADGMAAADGAAGAMRLPSSQHPCRWWWLVQRRTRPA